MNESIPLEKFSEFLENPNVFLFKNNSIGSSTPSATTTTATTTAITSPPMQNTTKLSPINFSIGYEEEAVHKSGLGVVYALLFVILLVHVGFPLYFDPKIMF